MNFKSRSFQINLILTIIGSGLIIWYQLQQINITEWFAFDGIFDSIKLGIGTLVLIPSLISSFTAFRKTRNRAFLIPLGLVASSILLCSILPYFDKYENHSELVFQAHYDGDINGVTLRLYEDGRFQIENYSILGGDYHYGDYQIQDDTIHLSNAEPQLPKPIENKLVLEEDKVLFELDDSGKYRTGYFTMRIITSSLEPN